MRDILQSGGSTANGLLPTGSAFKWAAEFAAPYSSSYGKNSTPETPFVQDFTLTYLLPSPRQLERRSIDY